MMQAGDFPIDAGVSPNRFLAGELRSEMISVAFQMNITDIIDYRI